MIGHLELAVGTLTSHALCVWLKQSVCEVRFFSDASELIWIWLWLRSILLRFDCEWI